MQIGKMLVLCSLACAAAGCAAHRECWDAPPVAPVTVAEADIYRDGGTAYLVFTDARGCTYRVCADSRMTVPLENRCVYINAVYPTDEGAQLLATGGSLAQGIATVLQDWVDERLPAQRQNEMLAAASVSGMSRDEAHVYRVLCMAAGLKTEHPCVPATSN